MSSPEIFHKTLRLPVDQATAFAYHDSAGALQRLLPPWDSIEIESSSGSLQPGSQVTLVKRILGVPVRYIAEHTRYEPPDLFQDIQAKGPFARWQHDHRFQSLGPQESELIDHIEYRLPAAGVGRALGGKLAEGLLTRMFAYRHATTHADLQLKQSTPLEPMRLAISGSSGLLGKQLVAFLQMLGHRVDHLVRHPTKQADEIAVWESSCDVGKLTRLDAVIHLAGKPIAAARWSDSVKQQIRDSRVDMTRQLCQRLAALGPDKPKVLLCASASGFYGDRDDETLNEGSSRGDGFLAEVAEAWEEACQPARDAGIRVVHLRFGMILSPQGGALAKTLLPAKLLGGKLGDGRQWWSWIALDDCLGAIYHVLARPDIEGPVNFVAPEPLRNRDFAKILGQVLGRPALVPAPAFGLRMALGEMADHLLLASTRVLPTELHSSGYRFRFPELEGALRHLLGRKQSGKTGSDG